MKSSKTTEVGFINLNGQEVVGDRAGEGTDHLQYIYPLKCNHCGHSYGANGSDIHDRRCPKCQGGRKGFEV